MIARIRKSLENKEQGFTLIELLVVIIIIGILAAIAIPAFLNQREKAWVSQTESDVKNAAIAAESFAVDNNGDYTGLADADLDANGFRDTEGVTIVIDDADSTHFVLIGMHDNLDAGARTFTYDSDNGVIVDSDDPVAP